MRIRVCFTRANGNAKRKSWIVVSLFIVKRPKNRLPLCSIGNEHIGQSADPSCDSSHQLLPVVSGVFALWNAERSCKFSPFLLNFISIIFYSFTIPSINWIILNNRTTIDIKKFICLWKIRSPTIDRFTFSYISSNSTINFYTLPYVSDNCTTCKRTYLYASAFD